VIEKEVADTMLSILIDYFPLSRLAFKKNVEKWKKISKYA